jgi:hypothetical protein
VYPHQVAQDKPGHVLVEEKEFLEYKRRHWNTSRNADLVGFRAVERRRLNGVTQVLIPASKLQNRDVEIQTLFSVGGSANGRARSLVHIVSESFKPILNFWHPARYDTRWKCRDSDKCQGFDFIYEARNVLVKTPPFLVVSLNRSHNNSASKHGLDNDPEAVLMNQHQRHDYTKVTADPWICFGIKMENNAKIHAHLYTLQAFICHFHESAVDNIVGRDTGPEMQEFFKEIIADKLDALYDKFLEGAYGHDQNEAVSALADSIRKLFFQSIKHFKGMKHVQGPNSPHFTAYFRVPQFHVQGQKCAAHDHDKLRYDPGWYEVDDLQSQDASSDFTGDIRAVAAAMDLDEGDDDFQYQQHIASSIGFVRYISNDDALKIAATNGVLFRYHRIFVSDDKSQFDIPDSKKAWPIAKLRVPNDTLNCSVPAITQCFYDQHSNVERDHLDFLQTFPFVEVVQTEQPSPDRAQNRAKDDWKNKIIAHYSNTVVMLDPQSFAQHLCPRERGAGCPLQLPPSVWELAGYPQNNNNQRSAAAAAGSKK